MWKQQRSNGERVDWLWKEYFKDPSLWCHSCSTKCSSRSPDFTHKTTCKSLWIDAWYNPSWVSEELFRREIVLCTKGNHENEFIDGKRKEEFTLVELFKDYAKKKDLLLGSRLHTNILDKGLVEKNPYLATTIISMYVKCGELAKARKVLDELPTRNVVSWAALIVGYVQKGQMHQALTCFKRMQHEGHYADAITLTCILKACGNTQDINTGKEIHDEIMRRMLLEKDIVLGTALVDMYAKCGAIVKAHEVLDILPIRNVVSWNALISGYAQKGNCNAAFNCFEQMQTEGIAPNMVSFVGLLKACSCTGAIDEGERIHDVIARGGFLEKSVVIGTALIDMYAKCGFLVKAQNLFDDLPIRNTVSWSALISGYAHQGQGHEALKCFDRMKRDGFPPDEVIFTSILKACGSTGDLEKGKVIHDEIASSVLLEKDILLGTALVDMYAKCGVPLKAQEVLEELPVRNDKSWCALIAGYVQQGLCCEALDCYERLQSEGLTSDVVTLTCVLKACGITGAIDKGKQIHEDIVNRGSLKKDIMLGTALVDMYAKCGELAKAQQVLEELHIRDVVCWSALIAGYSEQGKNCEALNSFERMQSEGLSPTVVTFIHILTSCGSMGALDKGRKTHKEIVSRGMLEKDIVLGNALVGMYVKCGELAIAHKVLEELPVRNAISWSTLISGYADQGQCHEALNCFERMQSEGLSPGIVTFICSLKACGSAGAIDKGKQIHDEIIRKQFLEKDTMLGTALIDMYAKCGMLIKAQQVLEEIAVQDVVSWNALIAGYAQHGQGCEALNCFYRMQNEGLSPDEVTCLCVLNACCHSGLLYDAQLLFENMTRKYCIIPNLEHHTCMVIIYGCAGHFDNAISLIKASASSEYPVTWLALLGSCQKWGNVKLGRLAFDQAVQLDNTCSAAYVLMAKIFTGAGMQEDAEKVETMRLKYATWKEGNCDCVDTSGDIHLGIEIILR